MSEPLSRMRAGSPGRARFDDDLGAAVAQFWSSYALGADPPPAVITTLAEHALDPNPQHAAEGTRRLFEEVIEPLCDSFTVRGAEAYGRLFARVIALARQRPECRPLDAALRSADLATVRKSRAATGEPRRLTHEARDQIRTVIVLSRLTLGADVAVCAPALRHLQALFPSATVRFLGGDGARVLARSLPRATHTPIAYGRTASLAERLNAWVAVHDAVRGACDGLATDRDLVVDPDSRLTQLGLLPPVPPERYFHFPSRSYASGDDAPLGTLIERWLHETFGRSASARGEALTLPPPEARWAGALRAAAGGGRPLAAVSFGVGGNERKRAGFGFEAQFLEWLVRRGYRVLLARGVGTREIERTHQLTAAVEQRRIAVLHLPAGRDLDRLRGTAAPLVTWEADVAAFFAVIGAADLYVGYDSAGQHIAAAFGVPTLSVFIECAGPKHAERWSPLGAGPVRVVRSRVPPDQTRLLLRACRAARTLPQSGPLSGSRAPAA